MAVPVIVSGRHCHWFDRYHMLNLAENVATFLFYKADSGCLFDQTADFGSLNVVHQ